MSETDLHRRLGNLERAYRRFVLIAAMVVTSLVIALWVIGKRASREVDTVNRDALESMLAAQYHIENPPPPGGDDDPIIVAYDRKWMRYRRNVIERFERLLQRKIDENK